MKWSILVCGLLNRFPQDVMAQLRHQTAGHDDIEVLAFYDNKKRPVGAKRNLLLSAARGEYISFVDDDDRLSDTYVSRIYGLLGQADVIVFGHDAHLIRENVLHRCRYSIKFRERKLEAVVDPTTGDTMVEDGRLVMAYAGPPAHTHVWRSTIAKGVLFPMKNWQEDVAWCDVMVRRVQSEVIVEDTLYFYLMDSEKSETR